jgi:hypothetical protein
MIKIQLSEHTDNITPDGIEQTKLPYPFFFDRVGIGMSGSMEYTAIGFVSDPNVRRIDLHWDDVTDLQTVIGMYLVTADDHGRWATHVSAISSVEERP